MRMLVTSGVALAAITLSVSGAGWAQDADRDPSRTPPAFELRDNREETGEGPIWRLEHPTSATRRTGR